MALARGERYAPDSLDENSGRAGEGGQCSLGAILVARSEKGVCAILLGDDPQALAQDLQDRFPKANLIGGDKDFEALVAKVVGFVEAPGQGPRRPLHMEAQTGIANVMRLAERERIAF